MNPPSTTSLNLVLLTSLAAGSLLHAQVDLGAAQGYNAVIFGNHAASSADTEGRLAVGGNSQLPSSYSVGQSVIGTQNPQSNGTRNDLVVAGNLNLSGGFVTVNFGNVQVGGAINGPGMLSQGSGNTSSAGVPNFSGNIFDFYSVRTRIDSYSTSWAGLTANGTVDDLGYELTMVGSDLALNVFSVTAEQWNLTGARVIDVPLGSTAIINISGTTVSNGGGDIRFGSSAAPLDASDFRENIIYNLASATSIQSDSLSWEGTVVAPNADLTANGGAINGQAFLGSAVQNNGFEFHNFSLNGNNAPIPEPSSSLLIGASLCATAFVRRRGNDSFPNGR